MSAVNAQANWLPEDVWCKASKALYVLTFYIYPFEPMCRLVTLESEHLDNTKDISRDLRLAEPQSTCCGISCVSGSTVYAVRFLAWFHQKIT